MSRRTVVTGPQLARASGRRPPEPEVSPRERAEKLKADGMPYQLAMGVARGRLTLNDALQQMARTEHAERLIREHDISRALAMQIALGHASLDDLLAKRRMAEHRVSHRERSCLDEAEISGESLTVALSGGAVVKGPIRALTPYTFTIGEGDKAQEVHKLRAIYAYGSSAWKVAKKALRSDEAVARLGKEPAERPQDRYACSDRRLFGYVDSGTEVTATLLDGTVVRGVITWFSRFEFALRARDAEIFVFRHALHNLAEVAPAR